MLESAVQSAAIGDRLHAVVSVEDVGIFKSDYRLYDLVHAHLGWAREDVLFVSSNGWHAAIAARYGFHTLWVNRRDEPVDRLPWTPDYLGNDLRGVLAILDPV